MKRIIQRTAAIVLGLMLGAVAFAGLETVTHISDLNSSWPLGSDLASTSDDHIRNIKVALKTDFPNVNGVVTPTPALFNQLTTDTFTFINVSGSTIPANGIYLPSANTLGFATNTGATGNLTSTVLTMPTLAVTGSTVVPNGIYLPSANTLGFASNTTARGSINSTGNWSILAPSSGTALSVTAASSGLAFSTIGTNTGATNQSYISFLDSGSTRKGYIGDVTSSDSHIYIESDVGNVILLPTSNIASVEGGSTGAANVGYLSFLDSGLTRKGYIGDVNASDSDIYMESDAGNIKLIPASSSFSIQGSHDGGSTFVDMTPDKGTFTATYTGMTSATTGTATWARMGNVVVLTLPALTGTSNSTSFTVTGLPSAIQPATLTQQVPVADCENAGGGGIMCQAQMNSASGTITMVLSGSATGWTNSGLKGIFAASSITYSIL